MGFSYRYMVNHEDQIGISLSKDSFKVWQKALLAKHKNLTKRQFDKFLGGNCALAKININGVEEVIHSNSSVSDISNPLSAYYILKTSSSPRLLEHIDVDEDKNINTTNWDRSCDSEAKILQYIASKYNPNSTGEILLYTKLEPCLSCDYHIIQFMKLYKHIELRVYYELKYPSETRKIEGSNKKLIYAIRR